MKLNPMSRQIEREALNLFFILSFSFLKEDRNKEQFMRVNPISSRKHSRSQARSNISECNPNEPALQQNHDDWVSDVEYRKNKGVTASR